MARVANKLLKVFHTTLGFHESVVAVANQREALNAWDVRQNLFAEGAAKLEEDAEAIKAALAAPGQPLRRPVGSKAAYALVPGAPELPKEKPKAKPTPPDRRKLDRAEAALKAVDLRQAKAAKAFQVRRSKLETDEAAAKERWSVERGKLEADVRAARDAFRKAGGR